MTVFAPLRTNVQAPAPAHPPPDHPVKSEPTAGMAVNVIGVPSSNTAEQVAPQVTPAGLEVTAPVPVPFLIVVTLKVGAQPWSLKLPIRVRHAALVVDA